MDLVGKKFGRLTVIAKGEKKKNYQLLSFFAGCLHISTILDLQMRLW